MSAPGDSEGQYLLLRLFVTGTSQRSSRAIEAVRLICSNYPNHRVKLEIIDVLEYPEKAEKAKVLATPTLIRESPGPHRRLIGDLGETKRIIRLLGLRDWVQSEEQE